MRATLDSKHQAGHHLFNPSIRRIASQMPVSRHHLIDLQRYYGNQFVRELVSGSHPTADGSLVHPGLSRSIDRLRAAGQPLSQPIRDQMEPAFGADFSQVRIHTGPEVDDVTSALKARAFTRESDIFFRRDEYRRDAAEDSMTLAHELAHVVQQGNGRKPAGSLDTVNELGDHFEREAERTAAQVTAGRPATHLAARPGVNIQRQDEGARPRLRLPTLEMFSALSGGASATRGRGLLPREASLASSIFGDSIDLSAVRIVESRIANAPTTLGNHIRVNPGYTMPDRILIHELGHIWQFQTRGTRYISDSAWHQTTAWLSRGGRGAAYDYTIVPGQSIDRYPAEHQASIIEDYFAYPALRSNSEYQRLIEEVRRARPIPMAIRLEEAAGTLGRPDIFGAAPGMPGERAPTIIPQIRIEF
jgi:hypothetical protein